MIEDREVIEDTQENDLLFTLEPGPRVIVLNNQRGTTLLGFLLEEIDDSFLVAVPSRLIELEGTLSIAPYVEVPYLRIFKSAIQSVLPLHSVFKQHFLPYLGTKGFEIYPDLPYVPSEEIVKTEPVIPEVVEGTVPRGNLKGYLSDALSKGSVFNDNGTKH